jgi:hypothetical protein
MIKFCLIILFRITNFTNEDPLASDLIGILREWGIERNNCLF